MRRVQAERRRLAEEQRALEKPDAALLASLETPEVQREVASGKRNGRSASALGNHWKLSTSFRPEGRR